MYPHEKYDLKPRIWSIIVSLIIYCGTYFVLLLTWTPIGQLNPIHGVLPRYFLPLFILIPFAIGFNNMKGNKTKIDCTLIVITIGFISSMIISMLGFYY